MGQQLTQIVTWIIIGAIAGYFAGRVMWGANFRPLRAIIIGLIGALVGGLLFNFLRISLPFTQGITITLNDLIVAFVGALVVLFIVGLIDRRV
jgi:uncharacterized membrane protein YeaQ/YmgE (transglycosylase-associated protein family)